MRSHCLQKLRDSGIESVHLDAGDIGKLTQFGPLRGGEFVDGTGEELKVDIESVERIADLMGDAGGEELYGVDTFALEG